jgi:catecholate siderophore receptor
MKDQGVTNLREVLRNVPGISIQAGEGGVPAGDNLSIRGFNARTDLFIDGVRDVGGYARDSFNFEQVEVVKGPASAYSGRGSTGGSVNIVTKAPKTNRFYRGDVGFGTDNYKRFTLDINQPFRGFGGGSSSAAPVVGPDGKSVVDDKKAVVPMAPENTAAFRINGLWHEADTPGRDEVTNRRWGIAPSIAFGLGTPTNLTLSYMHLEQENVPDYGIPWIPDTNIPLAKFANKAAPVDFSNYYGLNARDFERTVTDLANLEVKHNFNESASLRYLLRFGRTVRDSVITAPRLNDPNSTLVSRNFQSRDQEDTVLANQLDYTARFKTWNVEHALVAGVEYFLEDSENHLREAPPAPLADLFDPNPSDGYSGSVRRTGAVNEANTESMAVYVFDTMKFSPHWELSGGLRYDYFNVDVDQRHEDNTVTSFSSLDKMLSWRSALSYKPTENGTIYVAYGTSFNPSAEGLTLTAQTEALDPEESETWEVGTKWEFLNDRLLVSAAAFRTKKENARTPGVLPSDPPTVLSGEQIVQGFELGITGNITEDWAIFAGYTFLDSEIEKSNNPEEVGNELPNTPRNTFSLWTTYRLPWNIEVGAGAQFVDSRFNNAANEREADAYWTFDAMAVWHVNEHLDVRLNVYNLADEEYIDRVGGGHFVPGPGRSATLTASLKF